MPRCIFAASTVFCSRQAMVIGPTPPGTGVIAPGDLGALGIGDVADELRLAVLAGDAVDADVDHDRAGLDPVALDHLGTADGGDDDVGAAARRPARSRGLRVGDGHGAALAEQELRHRLADDVRAADDDARRGP